jgi:hypothetical protein
MSENNHVKLCLDPDGQLLGVYDRGNLLRTKRDACSAPAPAPAEYFATLRRGL